MIVVDTNGDNAAVGMFTGDEGKGKIVDFLSAVSEHVVRYEGGENAGHTIILPDGRPFASHLMPSGAAAGKRLWLCRGVRVNLAQLLKEKEELASRGININELWVDSGAFLSFNWHRIIEWWVERAKGTRMAYTTMRGMCGIAASLDLRLDPQVGMLFDPDLLRSYLADFYRAFQPIFEHEDLLAHLADLHKKGVITTDHVETPEEMLNYLLSFADSIRPHVCDTRHALLEAWRRGEPILWEGAQAWGLDRYWGPYGCSSQGISTFAGIPVGSGLPVDVIGKRWAVYKAIASRVGHGPFPTELGEESLTAQEERIPDGEKAAWLADMRDRINRGHATEQQLAQYFRTISGGEYGATSGRPRRVGWPDAWWMQLFTLYNRQHFTVITKLDCLSGLREVKLCVGYELDGRPLALGYLPPLTGDFSRVKPMYVTLPGWQEDITGETDFSRLPGNCRRFIEEIDRFCRVTHIGTGPNREHLIVR